MPKIKAMLLNAVLLFSLANFAGAADPRVKGTASGNDLKQPAALELLAAITPSPDIRDIIAGQKIEAAPFFSESEKVIEPGRDLAPKVEDAARVRAILKLIDDVYNNAPMPYPQDGSTFKNKEGQLPQQPLGFYKEYTLLTGGAPHEVVIGGQTYQVSPDLGERGSERVVVGGGEKLYYTPDHYAHFIQLTVVRS